VRLPKIKQLVAGAATFLKPARLTATGGSDDADYCYTVWLRHFKLAQEHGLKFPATVAELGPGDSLGSGIAAVLSGASKYYALDIADFDTASRNLPVYKDLLKKFLTQQAIPGEVQFPRVFPRLNDYSFPLAEENSSSPLPWKDPIRLGRIESALSSGASKDAIIEYISQWNNAEKIRPGSVDFVFSHAVMFYVEDLDACYSQLNRWLRPGGLIASQIDFSCLYFDDTWFGHWCYPEWAWTALKGRRPYFLNRKAMSEHVHALEGAGFEIVNTLRVDGEPACPREELSSRFRNLTDLDLRTRGAYILARKKN
jgi:SAM-dependent methyltransferase